ncbi:MAG TPA: 5-deoxy-glucuronate isomerase [Devosia sp.]|nr:5-deoxy-glucuronate isomerase [Devosia sp.]
MTGFSELVSLRIYSFSGTATIEGEAEGDEVLIVLIAGGATIQVTGEHSADFRLSTHGTRAIYLPPGHHYRLTPENRADVAYARARPRAARPPEAFDGPELSIEDYASRLQLRLSPLGAPSRVATSAGAAAERLAFVTAPARLGDGSALERWGTLGLTAGESLTLGGDSGELLIVAAR